MASITMNECHDVMRIGPIASAIHQQVIQILAMPDHCGSFRVETSTV